MGPLLPTPSSPIRPTVLLAEDDLELRTLIASQLRSAGYEVHEARNGGELIDYVSNSLLFAARVPKPALIITDVRMPGLSGLEVIHGIQRARYGAPVIVITAFGSSDTHERALELGALEVFDKPFDIDELVDRVREIVPVRTTQGRRPE